MRIYRTFTRKIISDLDTVFGHHKYDSQTDISHKRYYGTSLLVPAFLNHLSNEIG